MKMGLKIMLASVGTGIATFIGGYFLGHRNGWVVGYNDRRNEETCENAFNPDPYEEEDSEDEKFASSMRYYRGEVATVPSVPGTDLNEGGGYSEGDEEPPEMDMTPPEIEEDDEIPQPHPSYFAPEIISEEEYITLDYKEEVLVYYEQDTTLFNTSTRSVISEDQWDETFGIAAIPMGFRKGRELLDILYIKNDQYATKWRIHRMDASFKDEFPGSEGTYVTGDEQEDWDEEA